MSTTSKLVFLLWLFVSLIRTQAVILDRRWSFQLLLISYRTKDEVFKVNYRLWCADKLDLQRGKPLICTIWLFLWYKYSHYSWFNVLECITICSSAGTSQLQLTIAEHSSSDPTCCCFLLTHSIFMILTSFVFLKHARYAPISQDLCICSFMIRKLFSEIHACLLISYLSLVCLHIFHDLPV